jgi:hypothetical protein
MRLSFSFNDSERFHQLYRPYTVNIPGQKIGEGGNKSGERLVLIVDGVAVQTGSPIATANQTRHF